MIIIWIILFIITFVYITKERFRDLPRSEPSGVKINTCVPGCWADDTGCIASSFVSCDTKDKETCSTCPYCVWDNRRCRIRHTNGIPDEYDIERLRSLETIADHM